MQAKVIVRYRVAPFIIAIVDRFTLSVENIELRNVFFMLLGGVSKGTMSGKMVR